MEVAVTLFLPRLALPVVLTAAFLLQGCDHDSQKSAASPYHDIILQERSNATSDFERSVLEDGEITRAEYTEATQRYVDCMTDQGLSASREDHYGVFTYRIDNLTPAQDKIATDCSLGTTFIIEGLYTGILQNPQQGDPREPFVRCFIASGLVDEDYTAEDYSSDTSSKRAHFPFDTEDPRYLECMYNPQTHQ